MNDWDDFDPKNEVMHRRTIKTWQRVHSFCEKECSAKTPCLNWVFLQPRYFFSRGPRSGHFFVTNEA